MPNHATSHTSIALRAAIVTAHVVYSRTFLQIATELQVNPSTAHNIFKRASQWAGTATDIRVLLENLADAHRFVAAFSTENFNLC